MGRGAVGAFRLHARGRQLRIILKTFRGLLGLSLFGLLMAAGLGFYAWHTYSKDLPDTLQLRNYAPPMVTRVHAGDGRMLDEFATQNRIFIPYRAIPDQLVNAFISAEDKTFRTHPGIDYLGVARAIRNNVQNYLNNQRLEGASTITQQVAKNFLLSSEVSLSRKVKEAILAFRIEETLSKEQILELYLNDIYLGYEAHGVVTAAMNYFNKTLDQLTIAEMAYLAALPKAPNNYHPVTKREAAIARRNWVVGRMLEDGYITPEQAAEARSSDLKIVPREKAESVTAEYFTEEVRREIQRMYGNDQLYGGGLVVHTTIDPHIQAIADETLRRGLIRYDRRHGYRGPFAKLVYAQTEFDAQLQAREEARALRQEQRRSRNENTLAASWTPLPPKPVLVTGGDWQTALKEMEQPVIPDIETTKGWELAVVLEEDNGKNEAVIGLADGQIGVIPTPEVRWARKWLPGQRVGGRPNRPAEVLDRDDIVIVEHTQTSPTGYSYRDQNNYALRQIPNIEGALVAMDPHTGRVLAMVGGWSFEESEFNRATQAQRQPGSSFKPLVYLAALDNGFTPTNIIDDAPISISQGPGKPRWKPKNYSGRVYGPTPLRVGIEKSRNLMTVRLAHEVKMWKVAEYAKKFGVDNDLPEVLSASLGSAETTLLRMVGAYGMIANGGKKITPSVIDRIQDRYGRIVFRHDGRECEGCLSGDWRQQKAPTLKDEREQVTDPISAYQMVTMLEGVVKRGTAKKVVNLDRPIGGKTGTTNDNFDTWFIGFSPDLVAGVFVGFDQPRTMGRFDTGSTVAAPIFDDFMENALKGRPNAQFRAPRGTHFQYVYLANGAPAPGPGEGRVREAFKPGNGPEVGGPPVAASEPKEQRRQSAYKPKAKPKASDVTVTGVPGLY